jgi:hypothetical protein
MRQNRVGDPDRTANMLQVAVSSGGMITFPL